MLSISRAAGVLFGVAFIAPAIPAQTLPRALPPIAYTEFSLPNGLRVILHEDHSTPIVSTNVWYHVGSKNEVPGRTGFAHLFEHMMFQGSKNYDDDYFKAIQEAGATLNGSTNSDRTNYYEVLPSNYLERAIFLEADRMGGLLDAMTEGKLANQREVVKNEKRQNYDNRPYGLVGARIAELLYPADHPYYWLTIGSLDDLTNASMNDVKSFFRRYYTPNNASLVIAGDFNPTEARRLVTKYFGPIPRGPAIGKLSPRQPVIAAQLTETLQDRVAFPRLYLVWHTVPAFAPEDAALDQLASILAAGRTSRLFRALVYDRAIAQDVSAQHNSRELAGTFQITATPRRGVTIDSLRSAIEAEIRRIATTPPSQDEIERVYNVREAGFVYGIQTVGGFNSKSDKLNGYATLVGSPGYFEQDLARYRKVTAADVQQAASRYLTDRRLVLTVTPAARDSSAGGRRAAAAPTASAVASGEETSRESESSAAGRSRDSLARAQHAALPRGGPAPRLTLPQLQRRKLANGLDVFIVEHHELPVVTMNLVVKSGAAADPAGLAGLANVTANLIDQGTTTRSAIDIATQLASIGAQLNTGGGGPQQASGGSWDGTNITLTTLTRHLDRALDIYSDVITHPAFAEAELGRLRGSRLNALAQRRDDATQIANVVYPALLYGAAHPYGHPLQGDETSVKAISVADVRKFYESSFIPNNSALIVVGDVRADDVVARLERALAGWKSGSVTPAAIAAPAPRDRTGIYLVDRPGAAQSVINIGHVGVARSSRDYFPLLVLNMVLGGQFVSRVNLNLREDKGYTYGARTAFDYRRAPGPFTASAGVQTAVTRESLVEFLKELRGIRGDRPITAAELAAAKQSLILGFPRGFETPSQIAARLSDVVLYDLPADYFNSYIANIEKVTLADVERVAKSVIDPSRMAILIVGDLKTIEPGLRGLEGLGETITVLDPEGRVIEGH
jgi:zinc protease